MSAPAPEPAPATFYTVEFDAHVSLVVAAPPDMSEADVRKLLREKHRDVVDHVHYEWTHGIVASTDGDARDADRTTWIVNDARDDLVHGEETAWLPEPP